MNVLRICPEFYSAKNMHVGLTSHLFNLSKELNNIRVNQTILTQRSDASEINNMPIFKYASEAPFSVMRDGLSAFKKIKEIGLDFDVVHCHNPGSALLCLNKKELPPIVLTLHGSPVELKNNSHISNFKSWKEAMYYYYMARFAAKRVNKVVCVSPFVSKSIIDEFKLSENKVETITTGVDTDLFKPKNMVKGIDVLFVGRFVRKKQPLLLLKTIKELKNKKRNIVVFFIGGTASDDLFESTRLFVNENGLKNNVTFIKPVTQNELCEYYNRSKMLVLPSLSESAPKVALEAMSCSIPVVTTNILGNRNITLNNKTGFLVNKNNYLDLLDKIELLLNDKDLCDRLGKAGRKRVVDNFSWKNKAQEYLMLYESII